MNFRFCEKLLFNIRKTSVGTCVLAKNTSALIGLGFLFVITVPAVHSQEERYRYRLETSYNRQLCLHMTQLFNNRFRTPWDKGYLTGTMPNPVLYGKHYNQMFERLPGIEYDLDFTWVMLLSKFPLSPEFEAIPWKEGRFCIMDGRPPSCKKKRPMLVAKFDIDNDGQQDWVVKTLFIDKMTTDEGWGDAAGGWDSLTIFRNSDFDPSVPLNSDQLTHGQKNRSAPRMIDVNVALQLRPFIFKGSVYLSAYQTVWRERPPSKIERPLQQYPDKEYMNILRVHPGGKRIEPQVVETANTELVCRIRMLMQKNVTAKKGN